MKDLKEQLKDLGVLNPVEIYHNLSYDELYEHETNPALTGYEKAYKSPLNCKKIQPVHPRGDQSQVFFERTDVEAETPILLPPDTKS